MKKITTIIEGTAEEIREYEELEEATPLIPDTDLWESITVREEEEEEEEEVWEWLYGSRGGKIFNIDDEPFYLLNNGYFQHIGDVNSWGYVLHVLEEFKNHDVPKYTWEETDHIVLDLITNNPDI